MNPAETLLAKKILESEPFLDLQGSDCKLFQIAYQDFTNYLRFSWYSAGNKTADAVNIDERIEKYLNSNSDEFEAFIHVWACMWLKKWKSRVKLLFGNSGKVELNQVAKTLTDAEPLWEKLNCKQEMITMVVSTLIKNGEICGTEVFAQYLLKIELGKKVNIDIANPEQLLAVLNGALRRARETALTAGPLMYVKVGKAYFASVKHPVLR